MGCVKGMKATSDDRSERTGTKTTAPSDSRIITDYSTKGALPSLTLEIERDPVCSRRYGRSC